MKIQCSDLTNALQYCNFIDVNLKPNPVKIQSGYIIIFLLVVMQSHTFCQVKSLKYAPGFDFIDGIYISYGEFINNAPSITKYRIVTRKGIINDLNEDYTKIRRIEYLDKQGNLIKLREKNIWGICYEDQIYLYYKYALQRFTIIGAIMHLPVTYISYTSGSLGGGSALKTHTQFIVDFETGNFYHFNLEDLQYLLTKDDLLNTEFQAIDSKKEKKKNMMFFLQKFNNRNPIYFPLNTE